MLETIGGLAGLAVSLPLWYAVRWFQLRGRVRTALLDRLRARGLTISTGDDAVKIPKTDLVPGGAGPIRWSVEVPGAPALSVYQPQHGPTVFGWKTPHRFDASFALASEHAHRPNPGGKRLAELDTPALRADRLRLFCTPDAGPWLESTQLVPAFAKLLPARHWQLVYDRGHVYLYANGIGSADLDAVLRGVPLLDAALGTPARRRRDVR